MSLSELRGRFQQATNRYKNLLTRENSSPGLRKSSEETKNLLQSSGKAFNRAKLAFKAQKKLERDKTSSPVLRKSFKGTKNHF